MAIKNEHILAVMLVALIAVVALQTVQLVGLKNNITGNAVVNGGTETYDQMMQRMHGTSATSGAAAPATAGSAPRQVGGC